MEKEAMLYEKVKDNKVHCFLCSHKCRVLEGNFGFCGVRKNIEGKLYTLVYNEAISANVDPIEKKPLYHFLPGTPSYSIATIGCNFKCGFCQNWQISQTNKKNSSHFRSYKLSPEEIVLNAKDQSCRSVAYTYTEPTVFFEYAYDIAKLAKQENIYNVFVTNGYMTSKTIETINPFLDAANIDLKFFKDETYRKVCKGSLQPVLDSIKLMKKLGIWIEITTLVVPGQNDSEQELKNIAQFIASVDKEIPWHISRFHPDYNYRDYSTTPLEILRKAKKIGKEVGLKYVYLGNVGIDGTDTYCYNCNNLLIQRTFCGVKKNNLINGKCPNCNTKIGGIWHNG